MPITPSTVPSFYGTTENCDIFLAQYTPYSPNTADDSVGGGVGYDTTTGEDLNNLFQIVNLDPVIKPADTQFAKIFLKNTTTKTIYDIRVWIEQSAGAPEVWGVAIESEKNMDDRDTVNNPASTIPNANTAPETVLLANYGVGQWQNPIGFTNAVFINPLQEAAVLEPGDTIGVWIKREMTYSNLMAAGGPGEMIIGVVFGVSS